MVPIHRKEYFRRWGKENRARRTAQQRLRRHGITPEQFDLMFCAQRGACAICEITLTDTRKAHLDHDHASGKVRGILCQRCNYAIGWFKDDISYMRRAIAYLAEFRLASILPQNTDH